MIAEITILNLQVAAAVLMGYDYFVSEPLKEKANAYAADVVCTYQSQLDEALKKQFGVFLTWVPRIMSGVIYAVIGVAIYAFANAITGKGSPPEIQLLGAVLSLFFLYFAWRAAKHLIDAFTNGVLPFTFPTIFRVITTFLLYSSKGAIAALGMLFLIASFLCRYSNAGAF